MAPADPQGPALFSELSNRTFPNKASDRLISHQPLTRPSELTWHLGGFFSVYEGLTFGCPSIGYAGDGWVA